MRAGAGGRGDVDDDGRDDGRGDGRLDGPSEADLARAPRVRRRREPRYARLIGFGVLVGLVVAGAVVVTGPGGQGRGPALGYLLVAFGAAGGLAGALLSVALGALARRGDDRQDRRRGTGGP